MKTDGSKLIIEIKDGFTICVGVNFNPNENPCNWIQLVTNKYVINIEDGKFHEHKQMPSELIKIYTAIEQYLKSTENIPDIFINALGYTQFVIMADLRLNYADTFAKALCTEELTNELGKHASDRMGKKKLKLIEDKLETDICELRFKSMPIGGLCSYEIISKYNKIEVDNIDGNPKTIAKILSKNAHIPISTLEIFCDEIRTERNKELKHYEHSRGQLPRRYNIIKQVIDHLNFIIETRKKPVKDFEEKLINYNECNRMVLCNVESVKKTIKLHTTPDYVLYRVEVVDESELPHTQVMDYFIEDGYKPELMDRVSTDDLMKWSKALWDECYLDSVDETTQKVILQGIEFFKEIVKKLTNIDFILEQSDKISKSVREDGRTWIPRLCRNSECVSNIFTRLGNQVYYSDPEQIDVRCDECGLKQKITKENFDKLKSYRIKNLWGQVDVPKLLPDEFKKQMECNFEASHTTEDNSPTEEQLKSITSEEFKEHFDKVAKDELNATVPHSKFSPMNVFKNLMSELESNGMISHDFKETIGDAFMKCEEEYNTIYKELQNLKKDSLAQENEVLEIKEKINDVLSQFVPRKYL